jgi:ABC-type glycerol-3-phosphate transport system substrate-binding protein
MRRLAFLGLVFAALLAVPLAIRQPRIEGSSGADQVIVVTASTEQIREELGQAFGAWHADRFGRGARVVWSTPGGAVEIRRALVSAWESRLRQGLPVGGDADVLLGGGSFEFQMLRRPVHVEVNGEVREATVLEPVQLPEALVRSCYGIETIAGERLFDPQGWWYGVALSTFGIVWNQPLLDRLGVPAPTAWEALADARLQGWVCMVNPAQSGSILTAFESVVQRVGWRRGLAILRRAAANARTFAPSGTRGPIDVASGDAAMGVAIDFYARSQAQAIAAAADPRDAVAAERVRFVAPRGESAIDADPVGMLRNPPHRATAERFIEFMLTEHAQRLWALPAGQPGGPRHHALRRLPVMASLYAREGDRFLDRVDPFADAAPPSHRHPGMRAFLPMLFNAMAMDAPEDLRGAWRRIVAHPAYPRDRGGLVMAEDVQDPQLRSWLERFDAWPELETPAGPRSVGSAEALAELEQGWLRGGWADRGWWRPQERGSDAARHRFAEFFRGHYRWILAQSRSKP